MSVCAGAACALLSSWVWGAAAGTGWKPLFNGRNLNGWSVHYASQAPADAPPPASLFKVENGVIHAYPAQAAGSAQPNAYLETDSEYQD
jgi:hypothetical protein